MGRCPGRAPKVREPTRLPNEITEVLQLDREIHVVDPNAFGDIEDGRGEVEDGLDAVRDDRVDDQLRSAGGDCEDGHFHCV